MNLTVEYEELEDLGVKVLTIVDKDTDVAVACYQGAELEKLLEKLAVSSFSSSISAAIKSLRQNYRAAKSQQWIKKPLAWALHETWKEIGRQ